MLFTMTFETVKPQPNDGSDKSAGRPVLTFDRQDQPAQRDNNEYSEASKKSTTSLTPEADKVEKAIFGPQGASLPGLNVGDGKEGVEPAGKVKSPATEANAGSNPVGTKTEEGTIGGTEDPKGSKQDKATTGLGVPGERNNELTQNEAGSLTSGKGHPGSLEPKDDAPGETKVKPGHTQATISICLVILVRAMALLVCLGTRMHRL